MTFKSGVKCDPMDPQACTIFGARPAKANGAGPSMSSASFSAASGRSSTVNQASQSDQVFIGHPPADAPCNFRLDSQTAR